jgi:hypothetical protein
VQDEGLLQSLLQAADGRLIEEAQLGPEPKERCLHLGLRGAARIWSIPILATRR